MKLFLATGLLFTSLICYGTGDPRATGARASALGNASVALADPWSLQNNQAGLALVKGFAAGASVENPYLLKELSIRSAIAAFSTKPGVFGLSATYSGFSLYNETKIGFAFARSFGERIQAGLQFNYLGLRLGENYGNRNTFCAEAGIMYRLLQNLTVAAHLYNPTRAKVADYQNERVTTIMRFGLRYDFSEKVFILAETEKDIDQRPVFKTGVEYHPVSAIYLRTGLYTNPALIKGTYATAAVTCFGVGLNYKALRFDLASTFHPRLGLTPQVSLTYNMIRG